MNALYALLILSCFVSTLTTPCLARKKRPAYLTPTPEGARKNETPRLVSPFIKKFSQKNKTLARHLKKLELLGQQEISRSEKQARKIKKDFTIKQTQLEKNKVQQITQLQEQHKAMLKHVEKQLNQKLYDKIKQLSHKTETKLAKLQKEATKHEEELVLKTKRETLQKISSAELMLMENFLNPKIVLAQATITPLPPDNKNKKIESWKKTKQEELNNVATFLGPILSSDTELTQLLANKKIAIETNITNTQKIDDESYNAVMDELSPLLLIYKTQQSADQMVDEKLQTMAISTKTRQDIRFIILAELQPHIQRLVQSGQEISQQQILSLVTNAVAEVQLIPTTIVPLPTPEQQPLPMVDKTLRKQLAIFEKKLRAEQKKNREQAQQMNSTINELKQSLDQLKKEKLSLKILAKQTNEKLSRDKHFQTELESMKKSLDAQNKEQEKLEQLLEQNKKDLMLATMAEQKKQYQIEYLKQALEESKRNITAAQAEVKKVKHLQNQLSTMQKSFDEVKKIHRLKKAISAKQYTQLQQENIGLQKKILENSKLQTVVKQLTTQTASALDAAEKAKIRQKIAAARLPG
ncbi:hypothetical protein KKA53_01885 [Candidatus Dependentiae bacterium]|nr:hypothetical protein [Candidatus Dependentiae bacterium]